MMVLGDVDTTLAQGTFDPVKDQVTLKDGTVVDNYYKEVLGLPYYQPVDKTDFALPPSGWCTWYFYYYHITADEVKANSKWISDNLKEGGSKNLGKWISEAGARFNLSPKEEDFLRSFYE